MSMQKKAPTQIFRWAQVGEEWALADADSGVVCAIVRRSGGYWQAWMRSEEEQLLFLGEEQAKAGCEDYIRSFGHIMTAEDELSKPVSSLDLSVRAVNCLTAERIWSVRDLIGSTESQLIRIPNLGRGSINDIIEALKKRGLSLGMAK